MNLDLAHTLDTIYNLQVAPLILYEDKMTLSQIILFLSEGFVATGMFTFPGVALVILGVYIVRQNKSNIQQVKSNCVVEKQWISRQKSFSSLGQY